jgi:hypothetical protein
MNTFLQYTLHTYNFNNSPRFHSILVGSLVGSAVICRRAHDVCEKRRPSWRKKCNTGNECGLWRSENSIEDTRCIGNMQAIFLVSLDPLRVQHTFFANMI